MTQNAVDPDQMPVPDNAEVGNVIPALTGDPVPDGWLVLDGSTQWSSEWPEFVQKVGISAPTFNLPEPVTQDGHSFIMKMGRRVISNP